MNEALTGRNFIPGIENFEELITEKVIYIDKTSYLEDLIRSSHVALILRPRRFGKTLTMSMMSCFLEMNYQNPEDRSRPERLFKGLDVSRNKKFCDEYMGRFPVISISFKDVDGDTFEDAVDMIVGIFAELAAKFEFLAKKEELDTVFLRRIRDCNNGIVPVFNSDGTFVRSIAALIKLFVRNLTICLNQAFNKAPILLIDEYDVPLQKAQAAGYYDRMLRVIRGILSSALKTNSSISKAFVTGCLRIAHQSIFTGVNNFDEYGVNDKIYSGFIGLTKDETVSILKTHGMENRFPDVIEWYDGYNFGGTGMLCPWSVLKFMSRALRPENDPAVFQPENYWANSSGNDIIDLCMRHPGGQDLDRLQNLLEGKTEEIALREFTSYPDITSNTDFDTFATLMLHTGYLTVAEDAVPSARNRAVVKIPNKEVLECFAEKAEMIFSKSNPEWLEKAMTLRDALLSGDADQAQDIMNAMLRSFISVRDTSHEYYYHMFLSGALSMTSEEDIDVISQIEKGDGYPDIVIDNERNREAVILKLKKSDGRKYAQLERWANDALDQIRTNAYDRDFKDRKYRKITCFGISFFGKECLALKMPDVPS